VFDGSGAAFRELSLALRPGRKAIADQSVVAEIRAPEMRVGGLRISEETMCLVS